MEPGENRSADASRMMCSGVRRLLGVVAIEPTSLRGLHDHNDTEYSTAVLQCTAIARTPYTLEIRRRVQRRAHAHLNEMTCSGSKDTGSCIARSSRSVSSRPWRTRTVTKLGVSDVVS